MNPYTPIRQALGHLRAEVEEMYQDMLTEERAFGGEPAAVEVMESTPKPLSAFNAAAMATKRRGRPPKIEAPPQSPSSPSITCPDPDGEGLLASPASPEQASSRPKVARMVPANLNQFGVPRKGKVKPWDEPPFFTQAAP